MRLIAVSSHKLMALDQAAMPVAAAPAEEEEEDGEEAWEQQQQREESKLAALLPAFIDAVNKCEQASTVLVDASIYCAQALGNAKLGKGLVNELAKVDPRDYRLQQQSDAQGVKNVATFFVDMAERLPSVMTACLSMVVPHLGGEAYTLRSGIVMVIARIDDINLEDEKVVLDKVAPLQTLQDFLSKGPGCRAIISIIQTGVNQLIEEKHVGIGLQG
mmetsp:Transcript_30007/g.64002  ORF Transcript_30007/g.64002 Transcript_30007/m.64002 type:complete len:217 (-) Transcript_30007:2150-2800(-)